MTRVDVDARHDHLAILGHRLDDFTRAALVLAGQDDDGVAFLDLLRGHYSTSGARLMIFMCFFARSSRTTGPKMRVPIGSSFLLTSTAAFESKRITEPSGRRMSLAVLTITARWTSPFFTRPRGAASLTLTTMMSPTPATRRFEPPSTLMHWTRLAPLLSATSRLDCIWIMVRPLSSQFHSGVRVRDVFGLRLGLLRGLGLGRLFFLRLFGRLRRLSLRRERFRLGDVDGSDLGDADAVEDRPRLQLRNRRA